MNRPAQSRGTPYITREGKQVLEDELKYLWKEKRPEVTRKVAEAAALGDRSENAEYIYGKRQLREIDSRIRFLSKRLDELKVVERAPPDRSRVYFGAWVTLEDDAGGLLRYRVVGPDEIARTEGYISIDAPMARACIKRAVGDTVSVRSPDGERTLIIKEIRYE